MQAAVCYEFGKPLAIEDVRLDAPKANEVRVKIAATGICHSDLHLISGEWGGNVPVIYKQLLLDELISRRIPLEQINEAITHTHSGEAIRNVIMF